MNRVELIGRIKAVRDDGYLSATYLGNEHVGDLMGDILDALEQSEPADAQVQAALNAYDPQAATDDDVADWGEEHVADMRAALRAALAAGREEGR